jgi:predicted Fe-Mo cluster-binding NifX family protein
VDYATGEPLFSLSTKNNISSKMRIAISVWNERIAPVFDVSQSLLLLDIEHGKVIAKRGINIGNYESASKVEQLLAQKVELLICGALSRELAGILALHNIKTISFIAGSVDEVQAAYLQGSLRNADLLMPGFRRRRQCRRGYAGGRRGCLRPGLAE